ncbi:CbrC family protein [Candidatus Odyssella thessalonicensis]|uniref:CbrC family protein n=1 Tax=Candidatus Odyssella thessalonicensis TaxID=84647 RepID=UPI000225B96E|nr:CbrC family protein [Candidatus Odyssella thessalonicensis]
MKALLPHFKYHPDPLKTGNAIQKPFQCICCYLLKEYAYVGPVYSIKDIPEESICLDCIANGTAAEKFDATFVDLPENENVCLTDEEKDNFLKRTPGYISWQGQVWLAHCGNICEFHGDFEQKELLEKFEELKNYAKEYLRCSDDILNEIIKYYDPSSNNNPAFYKFICQECRTTLLYSDFT